MERPLDRRYSGDMGPPRAADRLDRGGMGSYRGMGDAGPREPMMRERDYRDRERDRDRDRDMPMRERDRGDMGPPRDMGPPPGAGAYAGMPRSFGRAPLGPAGMMGGPRDFRPRPMPRGMGMGPPPARPMLGPAAPVEPEFVVDREKTCPLLLRVWTSKGTHRKLDDYAVRGKEPSGDIQVYTWMDANLRELSDLIKEVNPDARARGSRLSFALIYPDKRGRNVMRQLGVVHSSRQSEDDNRTLKSLKFQTGDFMDVAVMTGF